MADIDPKIWEAKDLRITRQSMIKAAVEFVNGCKENQTTEQVLEIADMFVNYVYSDEVKKEVVSDITGPTPTLDQKKALEKVEAETGWNAAQVYAKFSKYPTSETADKCIAAIRKE